MTFTVVLFLPLFVTFYLYFYFVPFILLHALSYSMFSKGTQNSLRYAAQYK